MRSKVVSLAQKDTGSDALMSNHLQKLDSIAQHHTLVRIHMIKVALFWVDQQSWPQPECGAWRVQQDTVERFLFEEDSLQQKTNV